MVCPFCGFHFRVLLTNSCRVPDLAPVVCEVCAEVSLLEYSVIRKMTEEEYKEVQQSEAWRLLVAPARRVILSQIKARKASQN